MEPMTAEPQLRAIETAYLAARDASDATDAARATDDAADHAALRAEAEARSSEARALLAALTDHEIARLDPEDRRALDAIRGALDETDAAHAGACLPAPPPTGNHVAWEQLVRAGGAPLLATLDAAFAVTASALPAPGGHASRLTILARLATEPDAARRRDLFLALEPLWGVVNGGGVGASPYRRIIEDAAPGWRWGSIAARWRPGR